MSDGADDIEGVDDNGIPDGTNDGASEIVGDFEIEGIDDGLLEGDFEAEGADVGLSEIKGIDEGAFEIEGMDDTGELVGIIDGLNVGVTDSEETLQSRKKNKVNSIVIRIV